MRGRHGSGGGNGVSSDSSVDIGLLLLSDDLGLLVEFALVAIGPSHVEGR